MPYDIDGNNRFSANTFLFDAARGNIAGITARNKFGRNPDIDTSTDPEDVWNGADQLYFSGQPAS
jgi:hypothetical protein